MSSTEPHGVGSAIDAFVASLTMDHAARVKAEAARVLAGRIEESVTDPDTPGRDIAQMTKELRAIVDELVAGQEIESDPVSGIFGDQAK